MGGVCGRIFSTSLDQTCKIWEFGSANCLYSVVVPAAATAVTTDLVDNKLYIGTDDGGICPVELNAAAAAASSAVLRTLSQQDSDAAAVAGTEQFVGHTSYITGLCTTSDGTLLVSSSHDGDVRVWDVSSGQCLRVINVHKGGVSALLMIPYPDEDTRLHSYTDKDKGLATSTRLAPFKKYGSNSGDLASSTGVCHSILLPDSSRSTAKMGGNDDGAVPANAQCISTGSRMVDRACLSVQQSVAAKFCDTQCGEQGRFILRASGQSGGSGKSNLNSRLGVGDQHVRQTREQELEQENARLQEENERWKRVNNQLYETLVEGVLSKRPVETQLEAEPQSTKRQAT
jgi:hypothetical protein